MKQVRCARCTICGREYPAVPELTTCHCGGILDIVYDYDYIRSVLTKETLAQRTNPTMWRYRELLPVEDSTPDTPLRVGGSPLYAQSALADELGLDALWIKDDGQNPTASLKDRASAMAVAKAWEAGAEIVRQYREYEPYSSWFPGHWRRTFSSRAEGAGYIGLDGLPSESTLQKKNGETHGNFPQWDFRDTDDTLEVNRRNNVGRRFLSLLRQG